MNKKILLTTILAFILIIITAIFINKTDTNTTTPKPTDQNQNQASTTVIKTGGDMPAVTVVAENLKIPWDIAFLPNGDMLVTERPGTLIKISKDGTRISIPVTGVKHTSEGGLLGVTLHPDFAKNNFIYLYLSSPGQSSETQNKVMRYKLDDSILTESKVIIQNIPGAIYHDGGRMEFGPDGLLYITTGDATRSAIAQDLNSLGGKILRLNDDGSIPADNLFKTAVYSYGHRNPQGLAWDSAGNLWGTEHGPTGELGLCCRDELNLIEKGKNYGWPTIAGDTTKSGMVTPVRNSGASATWAPASLAYLNGKLYFGGLLGESLYEATLDGTSIKEFKYYFSKKYGRIRAVRVGPDKMLYITTSNRDGRGTPQAGDDKIIRVNPALLVN